MVACGLRLIDADAGVPRRLVLRVHLAVEPVGVPAVDESVYAPCASVHHKHRANFGRLVAVEYGFVSAAVRISERDEEHHARQYRALRPAP